MTDDTHPLIERLRELEPYSDMWWSVHYQLKAEDPLAFYDWSNGEWEVEQERLREEAVRRAWELFESRMLELYGSRDPECVWCGETVYMALQTHTGGGIFTTDESAEGPCSNGLNGPGTHCAASPDGDHSCRPTEKFAQEQVAWQILQGIEDASE